MTTCHVALHNFTYCLRKSFVLNFSSTKICIIFLFVTFVTKKNHLVLDFFYLKPLFDNYTLRILSYFLIERCFLTLRNTGLMRATDITSCMMRKVTYMPSTDVRLTIHKCTFFLLQMYIFPSYTAQ